MSFPIWRGSRGRGARATLRRVSVLAPSAGGRFARARVKAEPFPERLKGVREFSV